MCIIDDVEPVNGREQGVDLKQPFLSEPGEMNGRKFCCLSGDVCSDKWEILKLISGLVGALGGGLIVIGAGYVHLMTPQQKLIVASVGGVLGIGGMVCHIVFRIIHDNSRTSTL